MMIPLRIHSGVGAMPKTALGITTRNRILPIAVTDDLCRSGQKPARQFPSPAMDEKHRQKGELQNCFHGAPHT